MLALLAALLLAEPPYGPASQVFETVFAHVEILSPDAPWRCLARDPFERLDRCGGGYIPPPPMRIRAPFVGHWVSEAEWRR